MQVFDFELFPVRVLALLNVSAGAFLVFVLIGGSPVSREVLAYVTGTLAGLFIADWRSTDVEIPGDWRTAQVGITLGLSIGLAVWLVSRTRLFDQRQPLSRVADETTAATRG